LFFYHHPFLDVNWKTWNDVKTEDRILLIIGAHEFKSKARKFTEVHHFRDVMAALQLMMHLFLEPYSISVDDSTITDTLMSALKSTSTEEIAGPISSNSFGKVNKHFCRFVIDMLSVQLVFDNWFPFAGQNAPAPFVKETSEEVLRHIKHNQRVLISICVSLNPIIAVNLFKDAPVSLGWPIPTLKTIFSAAVTYRNKLNKGIISSWKNYAKNHVSINSFILCVCTFSLSEFLV
jgi:hypothetical protein